MTNLDKAEMYWTEGDPLPLDLIVALQSEGIDIPAAERSYLNSLEALTNG